MANRERGEFTLVAGEQSYVLRLTTNSTCELEEFSGRLWDQILASCYRGSRVAMRLVIWSALREHHGDLATLQPESLTAVGRLMDDCGGVHGLTAQINALVALNADSGEAETGGAAKAGRPLDAQVGTGVSSTSTPSPSA